MLTFCMVIGVFFAAYGMALGALESEADNLDKLQEDLIRHKVELDSTRPTAVNLTWATSKLLKELETRVVNKGLADVAEARQHLIEHAQELAANDVSINYRLAKHGVELVPEGANSMLSFYKFTLSFFPIALIAVVNSYAPLQYWITCHCWLWHCSWGKNTACV